MVAQVYAFLAVGRGLTEKGDTAKWIRIGRSKRKDWRRKHQGPNAVEEVLMDVELADPKAAVSKMVDILRGNCMYGPKLKHKLGGWHDEMLYEKPAFGLNWFETVYGLYQLKEIFENIERDLNPRADEAELQQIAADLDEIRREAKGELRPDGGLKREFQVPAAPATAQTKGSV